MGRAAGTAAGTKGSEGGCWVATQAPPSSVCLPTLQCLAGSAGQRSGKSITLACRACSCDLPGMGASPCLPPTAQGPGGEMQLIPELGHDRNSRPWPAHRLPAGDRTESRATTPEVFGVRFPPRLAGTQLGRRARGGRHPQCQQGRMKGGAGAASPPAHAPSH